MIRAFAMIALGAVFSGLAFNQAATSAPAFEVASVRVNTSAESRTSDSLDNGRLMLHNYPMLGIIAFAYSIGFDRVAGPGWLYTERYDIDAKFAPDKKFTRDDLLMMMQGLLAERFHLDDNGIGTLTALLPFGILAGSGDGKQRTEAPRVHRE